MPPLRIRQKNKEINLIIIGFNLIVAYLKLFALPL